MIDKTFVPSADWQMVDPDCPLPPGLDIRMDQATGENFARLHQEPVNFLLDAALDYATNGWKILPLHTPAPDGTCSCGKPKCKGKHPRTDHGVKDASGDPAVIKQWWKRWPTANLGLATGDASEGALVLDFDKAEFYPKWLAQLNGLADRLVVQETGRGYQAICRCDKPDGNQKLAKLANGETAIETRGTGGYIMAAPSLHPNGKTYRVIQGSFTAVPRLKDYEAEVLLIAARSFDQTPIRTDPWEIFTLADALGPHPDLVWAVHGVFSLPSLSIVYAAPGALKSFLLADMSVCTTLGVPWLSGVGVEDVMSFATVQIPTMWLDFDNGTRRTHNRFAALARAYNAPADAPLYYVSMPNPTLDASSTEAMGALAERIISRGVKLCIIDNLGLISGATDENSGNMIAVMAGLRWLAEFTGAAIVVIHHQRKSAPMGKGGREGETLRGHSSIEASLDLSLLVMREDATNNLIVKPTKTRDVEVSPFGAMFTYSHREGTNELDTARFFGMPIVSHADKAAAELRSKVILALQDGPMNWSALLEVIGGKKDLLQNAISFLLLDHKITKRDGAHGSKIYEVSRFPGGQVNSSG
jgi:hypothetical protein